jgi:RNA polymerase sigma-70 factor (ECF subfamily)
MQLPALGSAFDCGPGLAGTGKAPMDSRESPAGDGAGRMRDQSTPEESRVRLLGRIAARDRSALAEFYDQHAGLLYSIAMRVLNDPGESEEVIQDAFVQIWQKAASYNADLGTPLSWAVSIARNRAIDRLRSRKRRFRMAEALQLEADSAGVSMEPDCGGLLDPDSAASIRTAVRSLPSDQRQAIEMAFFGGLTHPEIAEALGEPLGTVKARIRRGMMKLRDDLRAYL